MPTHPRSLHAPLRRCALLVALAAFGVPESAAAQNVAEIDIAPPQIQIKVGQRSVVQASVLDVQGNILAGRRLRWSSANLNVARVEFDTLHSEVATVVGVGSGFVLIEARVGNVSGSATVQVQAVEVTPPVTQPPVTPPVTTPAAPPAPLPDTVFAPGTEDRALRAAVRIDSYRFGVPATCGNGLVAGDGLILTSYGTIIGADSVVVTLSNGQRVSNGRVASYDASADLAVLKLTAPTSDSLVPGADGSSGQVVWLVGGQDCGTARTRRMRVASREIGGIQLDDSTRGWTGAVFIGQKGEVLGVSRPSGQGGLASQVSDALRQARSAVMTGAVLGVDQVARRENQAFGSMTLRADVLGANARMVPLEKWQPAGAGATGPVPFTFSGPMGRYRAELLIDGNARASDTVTVIPNQTGIETLALPQVLTPTPTSPVAPPPTQQPQPQPQAPAQQPSAHGGGFPWGVVLLIAGGGGAAALLLGKKSGGGGGGSTGGTGTITVRIPNP